MAYLGCMLYRHVRDLRSRDTYYYSYMHRLVPITRSPFSHPPVPITSSCLIYKSLHGAAGNARNKYVLSPRIHFSHFPLPRTSKAILYASLITPPPPAVSCHYSGRLERLPSAHLPTRVVISKQIYGLTPPRCRWPWGSCFQLRHGHRLLRRRLRPSRCVRHARKSDWPWGQPLFIPSAGDGTPGKLSPRRVPSVGVAVPNG